MRTAIALSGGGTKGSYELGVWKALKEIGVEYDIVTGTSIGSINGALMVTKDYERAYRLWDTITMEDMMEDGINLTATIEGMYDQKDAIRPFLKKYVKNKGADISPFTAFIEELIDEDAIREADIDFGLVTVQFPSLKACELTKQDIPKGMLKDYILASAAIFPLFPMHKIDDTMYVDGCYHDNLPIDLALRMGAKRVIAVDLHTSPAHRSYANRPYVTYIKPSRSLGTMMNFDHELLMENARMGYQDTMKLYGRYEGYQYTFYEKETVKLELQIEQFLSYIARLDLYITDELPAKKIAKNGDFNRIHTLLFAHTGGNKMTEWQYFVRAAEISGAIFDMDVRPVYQMSEYLVLLQQKIGEYEASEEVAQILEKSGVELAGALASMKMNNRKPLISAGIYYAFMKQELPPKVWGALLTLFPEELTAALLLLSLR